MNVELTKLYLGVDGGQSHTEAVIADANGHILGRGVGGPSNHAEVPGGRERLKNAVIDSVGNALKEALGSDQPLTALVSETRFASAHFGLTGGADYKEEIISKTINADVLTLGHDAPIALFGATGGKAGVVVIAGTGSVVFADDRKGNTAQVGGLGYVFSDEGSGFWLSAQTIRLAIKEHDDVIPKTGILDLVLKHFDVSRIRDLTDAFYNGIISRDAIAKLSRDAHSAAVAGNDILKAEIENGARFLVTGVGSAAKRVGFVDKFTVSGVGGMFKAGLMREAFIRFLAQDLPSVQYADALNGPAVGALLMAFEHGGVKLDHGLFETVNANRF